MFAYEPPLNPPCNEWLDYKLPLLCQERMRTICEDILCRGERTHYQKIYDSLYELIQEEIESEKMEWEVSSYV